MDSTLVATGGQEQNPVFPARLVRFDQQGNNIWQKNGIAAYTGEQDIKQAANGKLIYATSKRRPIVNNFSDDYLQQYDAATGDTLTTWSQWYPTDFNTDFTCEMVLMENGDIVTAGMTHDKTPGSSVDFYFNYYTLRRTDSLGNEIWYSRFGKSKNTYGTRMVKNKAGNFVLAGFVNRPFVLGQSKPHPFLIEVSPSGDSIQGKRLVIKNENLSEEVGRLFNNIIQSADGNYVFSGRFSHAQPTGFVAKVDQEFNLLWYYEYNELVPNGNGVNVKKVMELPDSTQLFMVHDLAMPAPGFYLIRLTKDGQFISKQTLVSTVCPQGWVLPDNWVLLPDKSMVICGRCEGTNPRQGYIGRWGNLNLGPLVGLPGEAAEQLQVQLYPNPASQQVQVQLMGAAAEGTFQLYSVTGQQVLAQKVAARATVSLQGLPRGLYLYRVQAGGQVVNGKLVVE